MNDVSTSTMNLLEKALDVASQRQQLVTANIANVDTPGYQTKDIDFPRGTAPCGVRWTRKTSCRWFVR